MQKAIFLVEKNNRFKVDYVNFNITQAQLKRMPTLNEMLLYATTIFPNLVNHW